MRPAITIVALLLFASLPIIDAESEPFTFGVKNHREASCCGTIQATLRISTRNYQLTFIFPVGIGPWFDL